MSNTALRWLNKVKSGHLDGSFIAAIIGKESCVSSEGGFELSPVLGHLGGR